MTFENGIGGFAGMDRGVLGQAPCPNAIAEMSNGRSCFAAIIQQLQPKTVFLPWYVCPVILEVLEYHHVKFEFFSLNRQLLPEIPQSIGKADLVLIVNYFGLLGNHVSSIQQQHPATVVIDNAQAFYHIPSTGNWAFNSARKFFGVPDGAWLFGSKAPATTGRNIPQGTDHLEFRQHPDAFSYYQVAERAQTINSNKASLLSRCMLGHTDLTEIAQRRRTNYQHLHDQLGPLNELTLDLNDRDIPLCYPFLPTVDITHQQLHSCKVWVPRYWPGMPNTNDFAWEQKLVDRLLPLPLDQRYDENDMNKLSELIVNLIGDGPG